MTRPTIVACEDERLYQRNLTRLLGIDYDLHFVEDGEALLRRLQGMQPDVILLDIGLRDERDGLAVLSNLRALCPSIPVIIYSGTADYASAVEAMRLGATDYVAKDAPARELRQQLTRALKQHAKQRPLQKTRDDTVQLLGVSDAMFRLRHEIERIRAFPRNVVIFGESGVGKEVVARMLRRQASDGRPEPWVDIDSSTIQGTMAESLLFGHVKGAFTGADRESPGLFEQAYGGTVYFDEIANMSLDVQAKLLRVLQEMRMRRVGSTKVVPLDFRVIAATNRNLRLMSNKGEFRFDFLARLEVFSIEVPPLRKRREDIPLFVTHFLQKYAPDGPPAIAEEVIALLSAYDWPANVRELSNVVQQMLMLCEGQPITVHHVPTKITARGNGPTTRGGGSFREQVRHFERKLLRRELLRCNNNVSDVARNLQMDRSSLYLKLDEHGLKKRKASGSK